MRGLIGLVWTLFWIAVLGLAAWALGLGDIVREAVRGGHLLDWVMGGLCLLWLLVILKVPWDLYFQAAQVLFEIQRSKEREVRIPAGREEYIRALKPKLARLAVGAHLFSAALVAAVSYFTGGLVGYYFAVFYLVSTVFRPAVAGYWYLYTKLSAIGEEARYPREDVVALLQKVEWAEKATHALTEQVGQIREEARRETQIRELETKELRQRVGAIGREFEATVSRLTDNQEVINGIQAFVRLISQSALQPKSSV